LMTVYLHVFSLYFCRHHRDLHSFPTRRSSDLPTTSSNAARVWAMDLLMFFLLWASDADRKTAISRMPAAMAASRPRRLGTRAERDRKSTRLNSSHVKISYAVFCLKKKKKNNTQ